MLAGTFKGSKNFCTYLWGCKCAIHHGGAWWENKGEKVAVGGDKDKKKSRGVKLIGGWDLWVISITEKLNLFDS